MLKIAIMTAVLVPLAGAGAQTTHPNGGRSVASPLDVPANDRAQAAAINKAALKSGRASTLRSSDLVSATNDAGGRDARAVKKKPAKRR